MKRLTELVLALLLAPFAFIICALVGVAYFVFERESPFYYQRRVGLHEREFTIYKLRTMKSSTKTVGTHEVDKNAVTRIGKILRATKVDELPQLFNVLKGDMSLVGPRPCLVSQSDLRDARRKFGVFTIRPGLTGLSQIRGIDMLFLVLEWAIG